MAKKIAKKKKKKKIDHVKEITQYISRASVSLGAALYHARQMNEVELATDILEVALKSERIESVLTGKTVNRLNDGF